VQKYDGVLLINKPSHITSFKALEKVKKKLRLKKAGHAGTLDPFAEGLLVILVGQATKVMDYIGKYKEYKGILQLGISTDTDDPEGNVIQETSIPDFPIEKIQEVVNSFKGEFETEVPKYSAVKVKGKRLYKSAREGKNVSLPKRRMFIKEIEMLDYTKPFISIRFYVKKGTYVRSIARDIGKKLGCGAYLYKLIRTEVHPYSINDAVDIDNVLYEHIIPLRDALPHIPSTVLEKENIWLFLHGSKVQGYYPPGLYSVRDVSGNLLGIGRGYTMFLRPERVFKNDIRHR